MNLWLDILAFNLISSVQISHSEHAINAFALTDARITRWIYRCIRCIAHCSKLKLVALKLILLIITIIILLQFTRIRTIFGNRIFFNHRFLRSQHLNVFHRYYGVLKVW